MTHGGDFDSSGLKLEVARLEKLSLAPEFWQKREHAERTMAEIKRIKTRYESWDVLLKDVENVSILLELAREASDEEMEDEIRRELESARLTYERLSALELLGEQNDAASAFLSIHSGAGGTESCDWAAMLYRMYGRWVERHEFKMTLLDHTGGRGRNEIR